ncbi:MAG: DUF2177 family protein [Lewinellaceae bacterium]|nr:DUF2177 family protein [Lewinellaceae bacterium]
MRYLIPYAVTMIAFFALDMLWLGFIAKGFYRSQLGFILSEEVNWPAALVFYTCYIAGIVYFAEVPALRAGQGQLAVLNGALLGGLCYATYELTNMATISRWPLRITLVDIAWGVFLTASCAGLGFWAARRWGGW